jgi:hypothetical protein
MPHSSKNKKHTTPSPSPSPSPITRPPVSQQSTLWDSVKMGFGMSMGSRMFGFIFGDPTVKVEQKNPQPYCNSNANANATSIENNCDYVREQIKLHKCDKEKFDDNEELNSNRCNELFRQMYKCQRNI